MNISGLLLNSSEATVDYRTCVYPVPYVPLKIDVAQPLDGGVKELLKHIRPEWPTESIHFKVTFFVAHFSLGRSYVLMLTFFVFMFTV